jgi:hypothetical protein
MPAGFSSSDVQLYNHGTLVADFLTHSLAGASERVSFYGAPGTTWNEIDFSPDTTAIPIGSTQRSLFIANDLASGNWTPSVNATVSGTPILNITATASTAISTLPTAFSLAAPAAPAPPLTDSLAFAGVLVLQAFRRTHSID